MNEKINSDFKAFKFIFNKNKSYIVPVTIIFISIILFLQFVIPQFKMLLTTREETRQATLKLKALQENLTIITNIDESDLDSQLKILNSALPLDKDFIGILNCIYSAAKKAGVGVGNFSLKIGDPAQSEKGVESPIVKLSIPLDTGVVGANSFADIMSKAMPLSETVQIKIGETSSMVELSFYYKPLGAANYSQDAKINPISQKGLAIIAQLKKFENISQ
jgi:hypothetical protein